MKRMSKVFLFGLMLSVHVFAQHHHGGGGNESVNVGVGGGVSSPSDPFSDSYFQELLQKQIPYGCFKFSSWKSASNENKFFCIIDYTVWAEKEPVEGVKTFIDAAVVNGKISTPDCYYSNHFKVSNASSTSLTLKFILWDMYRKNGSAPPSLYEMYETIDFTRTKDGKMTDGDFPFGQHRYKTGVEAEFVPASVADTEMIFEAARKNPSCGQHIGHN